MSIEDIRAISNLAIYIYFKYPEDCDNYADAVERSRIFLETYPEDKERFIYDYTRYV